MQERWEPGRLAVSTAGRDRGKYYLVLGKATNNRVFVVDGEIRRVANPKLKNEKHLRPCPEISPWINDRIKAGLKVTDIDVRGALKQAMANYA